jgi:uncharacterized ParB-like nuclease family protein
MRASVSTTAVVLLIPNLLFSPAASIRSAGTDPESCSNAQAAPDTEVLNHQVDMILSHADHMPIWQSFSGCARSMQSSQASRGGIEGKACPESSGGKKATHSN